MWLGASHEVTFLASAFLYASYILLSRQLLLLKASKRFLATRRHWEAFLHPTSIYKSNFFDFNFNGFFFGHFAVSKLIAFRPEHLEAQLC